MNQREAVIKVMEDNGGYATLGYLYENALKVQEVNWGTKTPYASIRSIVQNPKYFFKIQPGLWALNSFRDKLPEDIVLLIEDNEETIDVRKETSTHSYYQGLLIELGNFNEYETYIPSQDHNKYFAINSVYLKQLIDYNRIPNFTYPEIIRKVKSIDVLWFNERKFPEHAFEVDHTTDFRKSLQKFMELQDFNLEFHIVSSINRENDFNDKISSSIFKPIKERVKFLNYDLISEWHSDSFKLSETKKKIFS